VREELQEGERVSPAFASEGYEKKGEHHWQAERGKRNNGEVDVVS